MACAVQLCTLRTNWPPHTFVTMSRTDAFAASEVGLWNW